MCVQAPSREILVIWSVLKWEGRGGFYWLLQSTERITVSPYIYAKFKTWLSIISIQIDLFRERRAYQCFYLFPLCWAPFLYGKCRCSLICLKYKYLSASFWISYRGSFPMCGYRANVSMGRGEFRRLLHCHLVPEPVYIIIFKWMLNCQIFLTFLLKFITILITIIWT